MFYIIDIIRGAMCIKQAEIRLNCLKPFLPEMDNAIVGRLYVAIFTKIFNYIQYFKKGR